MIPDAATDLSTYFMFRSLYQQAKGSTEEEKYKNVTALIEDDFKNVKSAWAVTGADRSLANHISDNPTIKALLKTHLGSLINLNKDAQNNPEDASNIILAKVKSNAEAGDIITRYFRETVPMQVSVKNLNNQENNDLNNQENQNIVPVGGIKSWANISDEQIGKLLTDGVKNITRNLDQKPNMEEVEKFIENQVGDLGVFQAYLNTYEGDITELNLLEVMQEYKKPKTTPKPEGQKDDELEIDYERVEELVGRTRFDFNEYKDKKVKLALKRNEDELESLKEQYEKGDIRSDEFRAKMKEIGNSSINIVQDLFTESKGSFSPTSSTRKRYDKNVENFNSLFDN